MLCWWWCLEPHPSGQVPCHWTILSAIIFPSFCPSMHPSFLSHSLFFFFWIALKTRNFMVSGLSLSKLGYREIMPFARLLYTSLFIGRFSSSPLPGPFTGPLPTFFLRRKDRWWYSSVQFKVLPSLTSVSLCFQNALFIDLWFRNTGRLILLDDCSLAPQGQVLMCKSFTTQTSIPPVLEQRCTGHLGWAGIPGGGGNSNEIYGYPWDVSRILRSEWTFHIWVMTVKLGSDSPDYNL